MSNHDERLDQPFEFQNAYDAEWFREQGKRLVDQLADYLMQVQSRESSQRVTHYEDPEQTYQQWKQILQSGAARQGVAGKDADIVAENVDWWSQLIEGSIHLHHPGYMGHQISPPLPVAALAGLAADFLNNGMGVYEMGQAATAIERLVIETVAKHLGLPATAGGFMTSGGTLGNLTALLTARRALPSDVVGDIWNDGAHPHPALVIFVSEQAHYCVDRAARIMGLGSQGICKIPVDVKFRMRTELLPEFVNRAKEKGQIPLAVVGCACTTSTGSFDDLKAIGDFCHDHRIWFHVDGAHGVPAGFSSKYRHLVEGLDQADSLVMDFHKTMMTPALATALIYREQQNAYATFSQQAQYLWQQAESEEWYELTKRTFECTKYMMGVKVFSILQTWGVKVFEAYVDRCFGLGQSFVQILNEHSHFELACPPDCNIVCFRWLDPKLSPQDINQRNADIRKAVLEAGQFYIVQTILDGKLFLRLTITNPMTQPDDFKELLDQILSIADSKDKQYG